MRWAIRIFGLVLLPSMLVIQGCGDDATSPTGITDDQWQTADAVRGGRLYDKWWTVNEGAEPTDDFDPIWSSQSTNTRSGSTTWRCKECHGWDYIGQDGRYSSGSHFTGFDGVWDARTTNRNAIFDAIKDEGGSHDLSLALSDTDVLDLTRFIVDDLVDTGLHMDGDDRATGSATAGQPLYDGNCAPCHGADGQAIDFDEETPGSQGVGGIANDNPQETLHKIRWGQPGTSMPSMVGEGLTETETGDLLAYTQTLPTE